MNTFLFYAILLLSVGVSNIATTSIGIQCSSYEAKDGKKTYNDSLEGYNAYNYQFLTSQLVCAIVVIICAFIGIYLSLRKPETVQKILKGTTISPQLSVQ
jgi:hypothetical protein